MPHCHVGNLKTRKSPAVTNSSGEISPVDSKLLSLLIGVRYSRNDDNLLRRVILMLVVSEDKSYSREGSMQ